MIGLLHQRCTVKRAIFKQDEYGTPKLERLDIMGHYRCQLRRKSLQTETDGPQTKMRERYRLYLPVTARIQAGDLVWLEGESICFQTSEPYKLGRHHLEVELERERGL